MIGPTKKLRFSPCPMPCLFVSQQSHSNNFIVAISFSPSFHCPHPTLRKCFLGGLQVHGLYIQLSTVPYIHSSPATSNNNNNNENPTTPDHNHNHSTNNSNSNATSTQPPNLSEPSKCATNPTPANSAAPAAANTRPSKKAASNPAAAAAATGWRSSPTRNSAARAPAA